MPFAKLNVSFPCLVVCSLSTSGVQNFLHQVLYSSLRTVALSPSYNHTFMHTTLLCYLVAYSICRLLSLLKMTTCGLVALAEFIQINPDADLEFSDLCIVVDDCSPVCMLTCHTA